MCRRRFRASVALLAAALLVLAASACGGSAEAKEDCLNEAYNAAEAAAVARMYDAGMLGSRQQVESELGTPERPGSEYFDSSGHLVPYRQLPDVGHKIQFLLWMNNDDRVSELTREARLQARANTDPDC